MNTVGKKMRELRLQKDWTLADLSKRSGVALSTLSRIESGKMTGTLESHIHIARALAVRLSELYAQVDPWAGRWEVLSLASPQLKTVQQDRAAQWTLLASNPLQRKILPAVLTLRPGKNTKPSRGAAGTERFLYLIKGKLEISDGTRQVTLNPGDSIQLEASGAQTFRALGSVPVSALTVTSPPTL